MCLAMLIPYTWEDMGVAWKATKWGKRAPSTIVNFPLACTNMVYVGKIITPPQVAPILHAMLWSSHPTSASSAITPLSLVTNLF